MSNLFAIDANLSDLYRKYLNGEKLPPPVAAQLASVHYLAELLPEVIADGLRLYRSGKRQSKLNAMSVPWWDSGDWAGKEEAPPEAGQVAASVGTCWVSKGQGLTGATE